MRKKIFAIILTATMMMMPTIVFAGTESTSGDSSSGTAKTIVNGLNTSYTIRSSRNCIKDRIQIQEVLNGTTTEEARQVDVSRFDTSSGKYVFIKSFSTDAEGNVVISYPSSVNKRTYSKWLITVEATDDSEQFQDSVNMVIKNIGSTKINAKSACIYCVNNGKVLFDKKMNQRRKQASTTKIMTALLIMEQKKLTASSVAKVSKIAANTAYGKLNLKKGDIYRVSDMMHALLITSSNEAANVLAEENAGSIRAFVKKMNSKAKTIGLVNTHYKNTHGLDTDGHYSSAYDLALLSSKAYKYKTFRKIIRMKKYSFTSLKYHKKKTVYTTDKLLGYTKSFKGGKTGFDDISKYCFVGIYSYKGKTYIATTLHSSTSNNRWNDSKSSSNI